MQKFKATMRKDIQLTILICLTIVILIFLALVIGDKVYTGANFQSMAFQVSEFAMLALGMGLVMLLGGIDLGIVANANMSGILAAFILSSEGIRASLGDGGAIALGVIVAVAIGTLGGLINGLLIS